MAPHVESQFGVREVAEQRVQRPVQQSEVVFAGTFPPVGGGAVSAHTASHNIERRLLALHPRGNRPLREVWMDGVAVEEEGRAVQHGRRPGHACLNPKDGTFAGSRLAAERHAVVVLSRGLAVADPDLELASTFFTIFKRAQIRQHHAHHAGLVEFRTKFGKCAESSIEFAPLPVADNDIKFFGFFEPWLSLKNHHRAMLRVALRRKHLKVPS